MISAQSTPGSPVRRGYTDCKAGQIHYRVVEGRGAPIVMLHQTASSGVMFEHVMRLLEGKHTVYALDTPGFGGSFEPTERTDMPSYAMHLLEAIGSLGLERFHVLGHHTGAAIAVEMAVTAPERLLSVSLIGPVTLTLEERNLFRSMYPKAVDPKPDGSHLLVMWDYLTSLGANLDKSLEVQHRELVDSARAWRGHKNAYTTVWDQDFLDIYARIKRPLAIMCAPGDILWPMFERARSLRPDAAAFVLEGTNFEPDDNPKVVVDALLRFIGSL